MLDPVREMVANDLAPANLPLQSMTLINRDQAIVELAGARTRARLLTLTGVGGGGKTVKFTPVSAYSRRTIAPPGRTGGEYDASGWHSATAIGSECANSARTGIRCRRTHREAEEPSPDGRFVHMDVLIAFLWRATHSGAGFRTTCDTCHRSRVPVERQRAKVRD